MKPFLLASALLVVLLIATSPCWAQTNKTEQFFKSSSIGIRPEVRGSSLPICNSARTGDVERVNALLTANPELVNAMDDMHWTPLYWAVYSDHKDVAELLIAKGADVN